MSNININGRSYQGRNVTVNNNRVIIDGKEVGGEESPIIMITVDGDLDSLEMGSCDQLEVKGNCGTVKTQSGNVKCAGNITGNVKTMSGNVSCNGNIGGKVSTMSGNVN